MLVTTGRDWQSLKISQLSMGPILRNGGSYANDVTKTMNLIPMDSMTFRAFTALYIQCKLTAFTRKALTHPYQDAS